MRSRKLRGVAAALDVRQASTGPCELVRAGRAALRRTLHDDGSHPFRKTHRVPEDRRHQRFLTRTWHALSAGADSISGPDARCDGTTVVPQVPLPLYDWWVARGVDWLAMSEDLPDAGNRVTVDSQGRIQLIYRPNNVRAQDARQRNPAHSAPTRLLGRDVAFARRPKHDAPMRHGRLRQRPPHIGPRFILPFS